MSNEKHLRKRVKDLESQMEKLVDIVARLTAIGHEVNHALASVSGAIGLAIGGRISAEAALLERDRAAEDGLRVDN